jgi:hypothetical protein
MTASPYRMAAPAAGATGRPAVLVYRARDPELAQTVVRNGLQVLLGGTLGMTLAANLGLHALTSAFLGGTLVGSAWRAWRTPRAHEMTLSVADGILTILDAKGERMLRAPIGEVLNVALDTKTIRKVQDSGTVTAQARFIDTRVGPSIDVARIAIDVQRRREAVPLSEDYLAYHDTVEWVGRIRMFLRSHGWVPEDER